MNRLIDKEAVYTLSEAAGILHVSRLTLWRAVTSGELQGFRVRRQWRVLGADLLGYVEGRAAEQNPSAGRQRQPWIQG